MPLLKISVQKQFAHTANRGMNVNAYIVEGHVHEYIVGVFVYCHRLELEYMVGKKSISI